MHYLWVGVGGFFGAIARYGVSQLVAAWALSSGATGHPASSSAAFPRAAFPWAAFPWAAFPWATLFVNVLGSFLIGLLAVLLISRSAGSEDLRLLLVVGFLGAFTTFSSFSLETLTLLQSGAWLRAAGNVLANLLLCLLAVIAGYTAGRQLALL